MAKHPIATLYYAEEHTGLYDDMLTAQDAIEMIVEIL